MRAAVIAFSSRGFDLAQRVADFLKSLEIDVEVSSGFGDDKIDIGDWAKHAFKTSELLVFIGAAGIAVRLIAPYIVSKAYDPAVIVIDEKALHCISLLSGHIGKANRLTTKIAQEIGADPVITTATDVNEIFAVDSWAVDQGMTVVDVPLIKKVSSKLLSGETIKIKSEFSICGEVPKGIEFVGFDYEKPCDVSVGIHASGSGLRLAPSCLILGIGCKRGTSEATIEERFLKMCHENDLLPQAFSSLVTIDAKADEQGILDFCASHDLKMECYTAKQLNSVKGKFHSSDFVFETVGTDNVCQRAVAYFGAEPVVERVADGGVTLSVGAMEPKLNWPEK